MPAEFLKDQDGTEFLNLSSLSLSGVLGLKEAFQSCSSMDLDSKKDNDPEVGYGLPRYTASYRQFNAWLRNKSMPYSPNLTLNNIQKWVKECDDQMNQCIIPINMVVKRGIEAHIAEYENVKPGDILIDNAVVSTSMSSDGAFKGQHELYIRIRKGSHASFASGYSKFDKEREIILPRGSKFKVISVDNTGLTQKIWCELIQ